MSGGKGVYRGRNIEDDAVSAGSLAGRAPLPEDRSIDNRNDNATASTSGTSRPKGNYTRPSDTRGDGNAARRNDDRRDRDRNNGSSRGRFDDRERDDRFRDYRDRNYRDRGNRNDREDRFAKQRAIPAPGKGDFRREDRGGAVEGGRPGSPVAGARRQREQEDSNVGTHDRYGRENGVGFAENANPPPSAASSGGFPGLDRANDESWHNKRQRIEEINRELPSSRYVRLHALSVEIATPVWGSYIFFLTLNINEIHLLPAHTV